MYVDIHIWTMNIICGDILIKRLFNITIYIIIISTELFFVI